MDNLNDLVIRAKNGDILSHEELYRQTHERVYYLAVKLLKNPDDALDVMQDVFITAIKNIHTLNNISSFIPWIFQITSNKCKNHLKSSNRFVDINNDFNEESFISNIYESDDDFLPDVILDNKEKKLLILEVIDNLPYLQKECILLHYFSGLSIADISSSLSVSEGTIKSRLNYGRKKIKEIILQIEEKHDIRIHALLPLGMLFNNPSDISMPNDVTVSNVWNNIIRNIDISTSGIFSNHVSSLQKNILSSALKSKAIVGILTLSLLGGGTLLFKQLTVNSPVIKQPSVAESTVSSNLDSKMPDLDAEVNFNDIGFGENMRVLLAKSSGEKITYRELSNIYQIGFTPEGMDFYNVQNQWASSIVGQYGTHPVSSLEDLKYFGSNQELSVSLKKFDPSNKPLLHSISEEQIFSVVPYAIILYHDANHPPVDFEQYSNSKK